MPNRRCSTNHDVKCAFSSSSLARKLICASRVITYAPPARGESTRQRKPPAPDTWQCGVPQIRQLASPFMLSSSSCRVSVVRRDGSGPTGPLSLRAFDCRRRGSCTHLRPIGPYGQTETPSTARATPLSDIRPPEVDDPLPSRGGGAADPFRSRYVRSRRPSPCPPCDRRASSSSATRAPRSAARARGFPRSTSMP